MFSPQHKLWLLVAPLSSFSHCLQFTWSGLSFRLRHWNQLTVMTWEKAVQDLPRFARRALLSRKDRLTSPNRASAQEDYKDWTRELTCETGFQENKYREVIVLWGVELVFDSDPAKFHLCWCNSTNAPKLRFISQRENIYKVYIVCRIVKFIVHLLLEDSYKYVYQGLNLLNRTQHIKCVRFICFPCKSVL